MFTVIANLFWMPAGGVYFMTTTQYAITYNLRARTP